MKNLFLTTLYALSLPLAAQVLERVDHGYLEKDQEFLIMHLEGTPYERGLAHGRLLKQMIQDNVAAFLGNSLLKENLQVASFKKKLPELLANVPPALFEEMKGLSDGSQVSLDKIIALNLFPEMFHCLGITAAGEASKDGDLYHVRVLDYSVLKGLEKSAVLMVFEGEDINSFLSCSYAGFIGVITGMNEEQISIGEIGGKGYGNYSGVPMAFLLRTILEKANTLEDARSLLSNSKRTCEYYYLVGDGKSKNSFGCYATTSQIHFINPGETYALFALPHLPKNYETNGCNDKFFLLNPEVIESEYHTVFQQESEIVGQIFHQMPSTLSMIGYSNPARYEPLMKRLKDQFGLLEPSSLMEIISEPVTCVTNLHNAIFVPSKLELYFSHASATEAASQRSYQKFSLKELLNHEIELH